MIKVVYNVVKPVKVMLQANQHQQFTDLISSAQTVFIMFGSDASFDQVTSSLALLLTLSKSGKSVRLLTPDPDKIKSLLRKFSQRDLPGLDQLDDQLGNQNLCVSFDYLEEAVDKVSYHIGEETGKFYLTIKPRQGAEPLNADGVEFFYTGAQADLLILVGVNDLESLESLYFGFEDLYTQTPTVVLNNHQVEFGTLSLDLSGSVGYSEAVASFLLQNNWMSSSDAATNLLAGIEQTTDNFQSLTATARTFEVAAQLMHAGARRARRAMSPNASSTTPKVVNAPNIVSKKIAPKKAVPKTIAKTTTKEATTKDAKNTQDTTKTTHSPHTKETGQTSSRSPKY